MKDARKGSKYNLSKRVDKDNDFSISTNEKYFREDLIEGRNAVIEVLRSERTIEQILVANGDVSVFPIVPPGAPINESIG